MFPRIPPQNWKLCFSYLSPNFMFPRIPPQNWKHCFSFLSPNFMFPRIPPWKLKTLFFFSKSKFHVPQNTPRPPKIENFVFLTFTPNSVDLILVKFWSTGNCSAFTSVSGQGMIHSQEMYDKLPIVPQWACGATLKAIWGEGYSGKCTYILGGILENVHIFWGGGYSGKCTYILGGYSGKCTYILGWGVFWEMYIYFGGYSGNLIPE